ncbi:uncharacterized protein LOC132396137 isoform X4 [Hypanus sabinus]|uniref:uncharacterized protein LOC132396137 isoform X4 n=1 Tax=Hypanus sabinus TaxID=79690 RepID=UPI0028C4A59A|nr:uncharacterized protein LOC132396137 isoform X4 [Hypanus sabinus]
MSTSRSTEDHLGTSMNYCPFKMDWLDSSFQETLFPGKPWHKVYEKLDSALACEIKDQLKNPERKQIILQLLGRAFVQKHLISHLEQPDSLHPPNITVGHPEHLLQDTRVWLQEIVLKAAEKCGCQRRLAGDYSDQSSEMINFIDDTKNLIFTKMEQLLARHEAKQNDSDSDLAQKSVTEQYSWAELAGRRPKSVESKDLHLTMRRRSEFQLNSNGDNNLKSKFNPPPLSCVQSEALGSSVRAILESDRQQMHAICERLKGKLLPSTLRSFTWLDKLLKMNENYQTRVSTDVEKNIREKFGWVLHRRVAQLKLRSATRSPISGLVENAVVEKFEKTPCMQPFATNERMILEASKALNVLYVYDGTFQPYLIYWLFPLQVAFKHSSSKSEHPYELAMYLHLLIHNLFPTWPEIFGMAERVMNRLENEDPELFAHLHSSFTKNALLDPMQFFQEKIQTQKFNNSEDRHHNSKECLENPIILLRKWMGEGFVGILDLPAVLLTWDQLFMQDWKTQVMEDFCLTILLLLREPLMEADDQHSLKQVFFSYADHLYTVDIQRSWIHLQQGGLPADIPGLNRLKLRNLYGPDPKNKRALTDTNDPDTKVILGEIRPFGVKNISVELYLLKSKSEEWLKDFNPLAVKLTVSIFYGNLKLCSKSSISKPILLKLTEEGASSEAAVTEVTLKFDDKFEFESFDPSKLKVTNSTGQPYVFIKLLHCPTMEDLGTILMGWIKIDLFHQETTVSGFVWVSQPQFLDIILHPGKLPDNIIDEDPSYCNSELIQQGSKITLTVYDPFLETQRHHDQQAEGNNDSSRCKKEEEERGRFEKGSLRSSSSDDHILTVPWVAHNPAVALPDPARANEPFDLYIDAIHYIPDNATITKVTGQLMHSSRDDIPDILAFPVITSQARCPEFLYRMTVNVKGKETLDPNALVLLRVYTVDSDTGRLFVIGNTVISLFNEHGDLNVGGFQLKLRGGMPSKGQTLLTASSLNHYPMIPCCSLLIRLLPHTQDPVPPPGYLSGFYFTEDAKPNKSELEVISSFQQDKEFTVSVGDVAASLMRKEQSEEQWKAWYEERLDGRKHLPSQQPPEHLSITRMVRYRQRAGLRVRISQVHGLKRDGFYVNAFARILKGDGALHLPKVAEFSDKDEKFLTRKHDFSSLQRSPRWIDTSQVLHPNWDTHSVLLIQIFSINVVYTPDRSGQEPGQVTSHSGREPEPNDLLQLGWSAIPLFDGPYVKTGVHNAPLFQGSPHAVINDLLTVDKTNKFLKVQSHKKGRDMTQLVLQCLDQRIQKAGRNHPEYKLEEQFFEEAMAETFCRLVEEAYMVTGRTYKLLTDSSGN